MPMPPPTFQKLIAQRVREMTGSTRDPADFLRPAHDAGLYGPHSSMWQVHAHFMAMMVGGISSLLMQALHPRALAGVWDHSSFRDDLRARLGRTAYFIAATTFGGTELALHAIERVNTMHRHVHGVDSQGVAYRADEPHLLQWVHLAESVSFMRAYDNHGKPLLGAAAQDRYFAEMADLAQRMGAQQLPRTRAASEHALLAYQHELIWDERTRYVVDLLENYPTEAVYRPLMRSVVRAAFHTLPDWALHKLQRTPASWAEKLAVRQMLAISSAPIQWSLSSEGVAAYAHRRVNGQGTAAFAQPPNPTQPL